LFLFCVIKNTFYLDNVPEPDETIIDTESPLIKDVGVQTINSYSNEIVLKNEIKMLKQKLRRKEKKIKNLKDLLNDLQGQGLIDDEPGRLIENHFSGEYF